MCTDHKRRLYPYRAVCYASMEREAAAAMYAELHKAEPYHDGTFTNWSKNRSLEHPYHFNEGVRIRVAERDLAPHDAFTTQADASPVIPDPSGGDLNGGAPGEGPA